MSEPTLKGLKLVFAAGAGMAARKRLTTQTGYEKKYSMSEPVKPPGRALVPKPVGEILDGDAAALEALRQNPVAAYLASLDSVESRRSSGAGRHRS